MKVAKRLLILILVYIGIIVAFESMIGFLQPSSESTLLISTQDTSGSANDRVVSRLESQGKIYVAANHWPRAWYEQALENPNVQVALDAEGIERQNYKAVPISGAEHDRVNQEHALPLGFRILTGFPPRYLLRLDPS